MTEMLGKLNNFIMMGAVVVALVLFMTVAVVQAKVQPKKQDKGLDEQVLNIKSEALSIAKELDQLEERLLYPSHTQISIFVSLRKKQTMRLDSVDIDIDGKGVAYHLYSAKEVEALKMRGVQRIYTGNIVLGKHELKVTMRGKTAAGKSIRLERIFPIKKNDKPGIAELMLSESSITMINR